MKLFSSTFAAEISFNLMYCDSFLFRMIMNIHGLNDQGQFMIPVVRF